MARERKSVRFHKRIVCAVLSLMLAPAMLVAQERTAGGTLRTEMSWAALSNLVDVANRRIDIVQTDVEKIKECAFQSPSKLWNGKECVAPLRVMSGDVVTTKCSGTLVGRDPNVSSNTFCSDGVYEDIVFNPPFETEPQVVVSMQDTAYSYHTPSCVGGAIDWFLARAVNVTKDGFRLYASSSPSSLAGCGELNNNSQMGSHAKWMAVGH